MATPLQTLEDLDRRREPARVHRCAPAVPYGEERCRPEFVVYGRLDEEQDVGARLAAFLDGAIATGIQAVHLRIVDCGGGVVDEAMVAHRALADARGRGLHVTCVVEERCHSAATLLALEADCVRAHSRASWLLHESRMQTYGRAATLEGDAKWLRRTNEYLALSYACATGLPRKNFDMAMLGESPISAVEAMRLRLVDHLDVVER